MERIRRGGVEVFVGMGFDDDVYFLDFFLTVT